MDKKLFHQIFKVLGSQAFLGLVGVITLPIAARGFGIDNYGVFSLFLILLGFTYILDLSRVLSVTKLAGKKGDLFIKEIEKFTNFTLVNAVFVAFLAGILGTAILGFKIGLVISLTGFIYTIGGLFFSILSVKDLVGSANVVKNISFAIAYFFSAGNAYYGGDVLTSMYFFLFANILILLWYFHLVRKQTSMPCIGLINASFNFSRLKEFEWLNVMRLGLFNLSVGVLTTTDKSILKQHTSSGNFGIYAGQADLALKINMISNSIGTALFPEFAKLVQKNNPKAILNLISNALLLGGLGYFIAIFLLTNFSTQLVTLILGKNFLSDLNFFSYFLLGVFINYSSFLTVPLQRAYGEFRLSKNFYMISAVLVLVAGIWLIPIYGVVGALVCYFIPRLMDLILLLVTFLKYFRMNTKVLLALALYFIELGILIWKVV